MSTPEVVKLKNPVTERDHTSGSATAPVTLLEYGNFECIYCGRASARHLFAESRDQEFQQKYRAALQQEPEVIMAHSALMKLLRSKV